MRTNQNSKRTMSKSRKDSSASGKSSSKRRASAGRPGKKKTARSRMAEQSQVSAR